MTLTANATPTKDFFIRNLTRDLSLEDAILDLIDNSIDAYIRVHDVDVSPALLLSPISASLASRKPEDAPIKVTISSQEIRVADRCGGISVDRAKNHVFRFGRVDEAVESSLGVYGIGMKRAIFKIGRQITVESHTPDEGFLVDIDVDEWRGQPGDAAKTSNGAGKTTGKNASPTKGATPTESNDRILDWSFPLKLLPKAKTKAEAGTTITIKQLNPEVLLRVKDPTLEKRLYDAISTTYSLFLTRFISVAVNGKLVQPKPLPLGLSAEIDPVRKELEYGNVKVELVAGLAGRVKGEWAAETAGWYVLCNGRVVVEHDKTDLTGWGGGGEGPGFVSKYRGFVGIAFFFSDEPALLPWTTTKRGLNQESEVYQRARKEMIGVARPALSFLNNMYPSEAAEEIPERDLADKLKPADVRDIMARAAPVFTIRPAQGKRASSSVSVQYKALKSELARIKKKLNKPNWGAGTVGRHTFDYFLRMEVPE